MNWVTLTYRNLKLKHFIRFLLIFSICITVAGAVWACSFEDEGTYSIFAPEAFVAKDYTPFFYDTEYWYYGQNVEIDDNNTRFNDEVIDEWDNYADHKLNKTTLTFLFLKCPAKQLDSAYNILSGKVHPTKKDSINIDIRMDSGKLGEAKMNALFSYLRMAKECEKFAVSPDYGWYDQRTPAPPLAATLKESLKSALNTSKDNFIKQRLWFQLIRYEYFYDDTVKIKKNPLNNDANILALFNKYKDSFPQNLNYYRALGYVAGYYKQAGNYAEANYLYSRCYDFSYKIKIPSKFSFRPQQEADWQQTLKLAKNKEEKITLWHMLGMEYDALRAIKEIMALDPKTDKADLLLSRLINSRENSDNSQYYLPRLSNNSYQDNNNAQTAQDTNKIVANEIEVIDSIALKNNTAKPYFWNIAAGYLNYMRRDYTKAQKFYAIAGKQLPMDDELAIAQYKMLVILLNVDELKHIDAKTEDKLVAPLNWLKNINIPKLRIASCSAEISRIYLRQHDTLKADCFNDTIISYKNTKWVQKLVDLLNKPNKTPFEKTMVMYYPHKLEDLYYHQATMLAYSDNIPKAIEIMSKVNAASIKTLTLPANPFNIHIQDCHDCDQATPQKHHFTSLEFLKSMQTIQTDYNNDKDRFRNALLLANAFYNISYYGNCRQFYGMDVFSGADIYSQRISKKYYLLAFKYAQTNEQRAKCTFMASKCEHNEYYSLPDTTKVTATEKYFTQLKNNYSKTKYYKEVLRECGYFRDFIHPKN